ncbi:hypothetical protein Tco_0785308 [Tanacetum coccineum]
MQHTSDKMNNNDDWLASDKIQHFVLCFLITIIVSIIASRTPYSLTRRHTISLASIVSLTVGAAKEVADELGFFESAGASAKDALADILGVFLADRGSSRGAIDIPDAKLLYQATTSISWKAYPMSD